LKSESKEKRSDNSRHPEARKGREREEESVTTSVIRIRVRFGHREHPREAWIGRSKKTFKVWIQVGLICKGFGW